MTSLFKIHVCVASMNYHIYISVSCTETRCYLRPAINHSNSVTMKNTVNVSVIWGSNNSTMNYDKHHCKRFAGFIYYLVDVQRWKLYSWRTTIYHQVRGSNLSSWFSIYVKLQGRKATFVCSSKESCIQSKADLYNIRRTSKRSWWLHSYDF